MALRKKKKKEKGHNFTNEFPHGSDYLTSTASSAAPRGAESLGVSCAVPSPSSSSAFVCIAQHLNLLFLLQGASQGPRPPNLPLRIHRCRQWHLQHFTSVSSAHCQCQTLGLTVELATCLPPHRELCGARGHLAPSDSSTACACSRGSLTAACTVGTWRHGQIRGGFSRTRGFPWLGKPPWALLRSTERGVGKASQPGLQEGQWSGCDRGSGKVTSLLTVIG